MTKYIIKPGTLSHRNGKGLFHLTRDYETRWYGTAAFFNSAVTIAGHVYRNGPTVYRYVLPDGTWRDTAHWFDTEQEVLAALDIARKAIGSEVPQ